MKKILLLAVLGLGLATPAFAADPAAKSNPQVERMKVCNAEYREKGIAKSEHRKFMSLCLRKDYVAGSYVSGAAKTATPAKLAQTDKMKQCNKDAKSKNLKGDERRKFMSGCLSDSAAIAPAAAAAPAAAPAAEGQAAH